MLEYLTLKQFGGVNTSVDSFNAGTAWARQMKNLILRPIGAIGLPAAWAAFSPGGTALDLGYVNSIDYLFDGGRLLLQDSAGAWWDVSPRNTGVPNNIVVSTPGTTLTANLTLTAGQRLAFKISANLHYQIATSATVGNYVIDALGSVPYYSTRYTADRAFEYGYGPIIPDGSGNNWKLQADSTTGLYAVVV